MGDVRFAPALWLAEEAQRRGKLRSLATDTAIKALSDLASRTDPLLANILATHLLNETRHSAAIIGASPDAIISVDHDGRILFANPAALKMFGSRKIVGTDLHALVHPGGADGCPLRTALSATSSDGEYEDLFEAADGGVIPVAFTAAEARHDGTSLGHVLIIRDVAEQRAREAKLAGFQAALDGVARPTFLVDQQARFVYANRAAGDLLASAPSDLIGRSIFDLDLDLPEDGWDAWWSGIAARKRMTLATQVRTPSGIHPTVIEAMCVTGEVTPYHLVVLRSQDLDGETMAEDQKV